MLVSIHPLNPQFRLLRPIVETLACGGVIVYPTDVAYGLACALGEKEAIARILRIRALSAQHPFTLMCRSISEISHYARVENADYRILRSYLPGPYTFILKASRAVPKRLWHHKRATIGFRVADHLITQQLLEQFNQPLLTTTLILPGSEWPLTDPQEMEAQLGDQVDWIIDAGMGSITSTSVVDLTQGYPQVMRVGLGDITHF